MTNIYYQDIILPVYEIMIARVGSDECLSTGADCIRDKFAS